MEALQAKQTVIDALLAAHETYRMLGSDASKNISVNQFGDTAMQIDVESEEAVLRQLKRIGINYVLNSEEHGTIPAKDAATPAYLAVVDGLDGSSAFKKDPVASWAGCMFALFDTDNPKYDDYLATGIVHHAIGKLVIAVKGQGVSIIDMSTQSEDKLPSDVMDNPRLPICVDRCNFSPNDPIAPYGAIEQKLNDLVTSLGYVTTSSGSTAEDFTRHLFGQNQAVIESTRKGNLEFATAYALIHEAGKF